MWWVKTNSSGDDRNGFQDRDLGKHHHDPAEFGPDFGVDYARYSDPPDIQKDILLKDHLDKKLSSTYPYRFEVKARNGFVVIRGNVPDEDTRNAVLETVHAQEGVLDVISDIHVMKESP